MASPMPPTPLLKAKVAIEATMDLGMHSNWRGHSTPDTHLCRRDFLGTGRMRMFPEAVGSFHVSDTTSSFL